MTKTCEACHTVNRDRAMYCRGCAGRFKNVDPTANMSSVWVPGASGMRGAVLAGASHAEALRMAPEAPRQAPPAAEHTATPMANAWASVLLPASAVVMAALVVWQEWPGREAPRTPPAHELAHTQRVPSPIETPAPAAPVAVPKESLLALNLEQRAKAQAATRDSLGPNEEVVLGRFDETQSDSGLAPDSGADGTVTGPTIEPRPSTAAPRATHRVAASRTYTAPARTPVQAWPAQGFTGPCNRYNPYGEALCANAPSPQRQAPIRNASAR